MNLNSQNDSMLDLRSVTVCVYPTYYTRAALYDTCSRFAGPKWSFNSISDRHKYTRCVQKAIVGGGRGRCLLRTVVVRLTSQRRRRYLPPLGVIVAATPSRGGQRGRHDWWGAHRPKSVFSCRLRYTYTTRDPYARLARWSVHARQCRRVRSADAR